MFSHKLFINEYLLVSHMIENNLVISMLMFLKDHFLFWCSGRRCASKYMKVHGFSMWFSSVLFMPSAWLVDKHFLDPWIDHANLIPCPSCSDLIPFVVLYEDALKGRYLSLKFKTTVA
jgi:hypothetical protein